MSAFIFTINHKLNYVNIWPCIISKSFRTRFHLYNQIEFKVALFSEPYITPCFSKPHRTMNAGEIYIMERLLLPCPFALRLPEELFQLI